MKTTDQKLTSQLIKSVNDYVDFKSMSIIEQFITGDIYIKICNHQGQITDLKQAKIGLVIKAEDIPLVKEQGQKRLKSKYKKQIQEQCTSLASRILNQQEQEIYNRKIKKILQATA